MNGHEDPYGTLAAPFLDHYETLRGRLRLALVAEQLDQFLGDGPLNVLDVGAGAGHQALRLAELGHRVTLLDPSRQMLARATDALANRPAEVRSHVEMVEGYAHDAAKLLGNRRFEVICCHGVLPYVDDAVGLLAQIAHLATPGGLISVVFKNRDALAMRAGLERRWKDALAAFDAPADVGGVGVSTRAHTLGEVCDALAGSGASVEAWFGIRVITDHLVGEKPDEFEDVLAVERRMSSRDPYRHVARLLHVVARAPGSPKREALWGTKRHVPASSSSVGLTEPSGCLFRRMW